MTFVSQSQKNLPMKRILLMIVCITSCLVCKAQEKNQFNFTFNHLALSVKDLSRSVQFYTTVFQLPEITNRTANPSIRWISLGDGKELHLITNPDKLVLNKTVHLALTTSGIDAFIKRLKDLKVTYGDWGGTANAITVRADDIKQIYLQDPDGYWIEVNNSTPDK